MKSSFHPPASPPKTLNEFQCSLYGSHPSASFHRIFLERPNRLIFFPTTCAPETPPSYAEKGSLPARLICREIYTRRPTCIFKENKFLETNRHSSVPYSLEQSSSPLKILFDISFCSLTSKNVIFFS